MSTSKSKAAMTIADYRFLYFGILSGATGGLAEILWVWTYSAKSNVDAAQIARGVAEAVGARGILASISAGIAIHMFFAGLLGIAVVAALRALPVKIRTWPFELSVAIGTLAIVWAFNFLILLPTVSPAFVTVIPFSASIISKFLFGLSTFFVFKLIDRISKI